VPGRVVKFGKVARSMLRNGPVDGNALRIQRRGGVVALEVRYDLESTARGHVGLPADPAVLRSVAAAILKEAAAIEREAEEPDEVVLRDEYEPDEVVVPEVYEGLGRRSSGRYCEFPGDEESPWDGEKKGKCEHVGISHCQLHKEEHKTDAEGWRLCCDACETPYYEVGAGRVRVDEESEDE